MKNLKKLTALLLALTATLSFVAACGGGQQNNSTSQSGTSSESTSSIDESFTSESGEKDPSIDESFTPEPPETVWGEWELVKEPTCTEDGQKIRFEVNNESVSQTAKIEARGHDYSGENITCIRCGLSGLIDPGTFGTDFPVAEACTHTDLEIYEGQCDCAYQGRGEEYSRLQLTEGCYTVETVNNGEVVNAIWLSFSVKEAGQYMLYSFDNNDKVTAARYDASAHYVTPVPYNAFVKGGNFFSYVSCSEQHFNEEWRATFCLKAEAGTPVKIGFVKIDDPVWMRMNVSVPTYPTEINGKKAPEAPAGTKAVEVAYDSEYYYSDPAFGGDGYYHLQDTDEVIYAAITSTPARLLLNSNFASIHYEGSALNLQDGYTADGDYRIRSYVPFIMNCADDNDIFNTELKPDLSKNCYQNYCNSDGMYPVNKELFKFLNLYVQSTKPIDNAITVDDWKNKEDWLWLSACYTYKSIVAGTEENPLSLEIGDNTVTVPMYDYLFCNLKADGIYTIKCETEKATLSLGQNVMLTAPFEITVQTSVSSPIKFELGTTDGKGAEATLTVTQTVGVSNGLNADGAKAFEVDALGELTLETVTIYGANESVSYYAYYTYTATSDGKLYLNVKGETTASVVLGDTYASEGTASIDVVAGDVVIIYVSNASAPASVTVTLAYDQSQSMNK